jgi:transposase
MTTMAQPDVVVTGPVEVHLDVHVAAAPDSASAANSASTACRPPRPATGVCSRGWQAFGTVARVGGEATGSYSRRAGPLPDRRGHRRGRGRPAQPLKTGDVVAPPTPVDALSAARAALSGDACGQAKARNGAGEAIRVLPVARAAARHDRRRSAQPDAQPHLHCCG